MSYPPVLLKNRSGFLSRALHCITIICTICIARICVDFSKATLRYTSLPIHHMYRMLRTRNHKNQCSACSNNTTISHHAVVWTQRILWVPMYRGSRCIMSVYLRLSERGVACFLLDMMRAIPHDSWPVSRGGLRAFLSFSPSPSFSHTRSTLFISLVFPFLYYSLLFVFRFRAQVPRRARRCKRDHAIRPTDRPTVAARPLRVGS